MRTIDRFLLGLRGQGVGTSPGAAYTRAWAGVRGGNRLHRHQAHPGVPSLSRGAPKRTTQLLDQPGEKQRFSGSSESPEILKKAAGCRGFWPRYARLKTTHPPKVSQRQPGSTPTHPHADSEICNHNYTAPANEQGPAAPAGSSSRQQARCLQRIVFTKTTSAPSEERSATDFVKFVHSVSFYPASTASYWNLPTNVQPASSQLPLLATASSRATTP